MPEVSLDKIPEFSRVPLRQARELEGVSLQGIYNLLETSLAWAYAENSGLGPKRVRIVDGRSLTHGTPDLPGAFEKWLASTARERTQTSPFFNPNLAAASTSGPLAPAAKGTPLENSPVAGCLSPGEHQGDLFLSPIGERLQGPYEEKRIADQRLAIIQPALNGDYRKTHSSKDSFLQWKAEASGVHKKTLERWCSAYRKAGGGVRGLQALMRSKPGPKPSGPRLEDWAKAKIHLDRKAGYTAEQCYTRLLQDDNGVAGKQPACGISGIYPIPSIWTVKRYFASLGAPAKAAREGRSALKAAEMQIHRTYTDCRTLDRVDNDEWITDVFSFDPDSLLWRSGKKKGQPRVGRFYLLTMLDERSIYPLDASLVEFPDHENEVDLLTSICLQYGIPRLINSDRGRFRWDGFHRHKRWFNREPVRAAQNGILDRLNVGHNMPREHNPQGNRLERFHLELARFSRTLPGWCGASTEERDELSNAAETLRAHEDYCYGRSKTTPLLSREELLQRYLEFFKEWREHQSEGTDMNGLTPSIVFRREMPAEGFRLVTPEELDRATAQLYEDVLVQVGGHVDIPEGNYRSTRYYSHELLLIQGQRRNVERSRLNRSKIFVLPAREGEPEIVAYAMPRVGVSDPAHLGLAIAEKTFSKKLLRAATEPPAKPDLPLISSNEWMMRREVIPSARERINPEEFIGGPPASDEKPVPSLYDLTDCTAEES